MNDPPYRLLYAGLVFAVVAQVLVVWFVASTSDGAVGVGAGNVAAAVVCLGAIWLLRQKQKGRL